MACYHPLQGWRSQTVNESGKRSIVFNRKHAYLDMPIKIPCGQCIGCRLDYSRQWAVRCVHELQSYDRSAYITLTFNKDSLPSDRSVRVRDLQLFFKRFRKEISPNRIRYFACGEYGDENQRPHYHAIIYGYDFPDKYPCGVNKQGDTLYTSPFLSQVWPFGYNWIGNVTFQSCAYVARYILKKQKSKDVEHHIMVDPDTGEMFFGDKQFCIMSRGGRAPEGENLGGIGSRWFKKFKSDTDKDYITLSGQRIGLPKFYDMLLERDDPNEFLSRKSKRRYIAKLREHDNTPTRLREKEIVKKSKINGLLKRNME